MSEDDNVANSFAERRLDKLEEHKLKMTGLRQKYGHLINPKKDNTAESDERRSAIDGFQVTNEEVAARNSNKIDKSFEGMQKELGRRANLNIGKSEGNP